MRLLQTKTQLKKPLVWLEIDTEALTSNVQQMKILLNGRKIMAVLKANAYGLGAPSVAASIEKLVDLFGVVGLRESLELRTNGITKSVVNLGMYCNEDAPVLIKNAITPSIFTQRDLKDFELAAKALKSRAAVWLKIDTGLTRLGAPASEALSLIRYASARNNIFIAGVYSTLTENSALDRKQLAQFLKIKRLCEKEKIKIPAWSIATSEAAFLFKDSWLDVVRLGISLLGYYPSKRAEKTRPAILQPSATYKTRVACIKEIEKGESIFYRKKFIAKKKTRIAILLPGYSYGLNPKLAPGGSVLIQGRRFPLVGGISATNCFANIGMDTAIKVNDGAVLFGRQQGKEICLTEVCKITKENFYECLSRIPEKVERRYL